MPTFENLIIAAPAGFSPSCTSLNNLCGTEGEIERLVSLALSAASSSAKRASSEAKTISFIIRSYKSAVPQPTFPQVAAVLDQNTLLTRDCVEKIIIAMQSQAESASSSSSLLSQISGKIQNFKWRVGVAVSSSKCKNLSSPYVLVSFDVKELDGGLTSHSCELTYEQFQQFKAAFERAAAAMDEL